MYLISYGVSAMVTPITHMFNRTHNSMTEKREAVCAAHNCRRSLHLYQNLLIQLNMIDSVVLKWL